MTFDAPFNKKIQQDEEYNIAGEDLANYLAEELIKRGFLVNKVENIEFAFEIKCMSGTIEYEIMVALDVLYHERWEIAVQPRYGFWARLFGKNEDQELGGLLNGINDILKENASVTDIKWYRQYSNPDSLKNKKFFNSPVE